MQLHSILSFMFIAATMALPDCTNGGTLACCQATVAGDLRVIQFLAHAINFTLTPNDINCIECRKTDFYQDMRPVVLYCNLS